MPIQREVVMKKLMDKGEEMVGRITNQVLSNEKFLAAIQQVIARAIGTKLVLDKNVQQALSSLNLLSTADLRKVEEKIADLELILDGIDAKVTAIQRKMDGEGPAEAAKKAAKKG